MKELSPAKRIGGTLTVPGDKSIAHRAALVSILADAPLTVKNFPDGADCARSLEFARTCGVQIKAVEGGLHLTPPDRHQLPAQVAIDCGNSGTTARLGSGILAGLPIQATLTGDESLSKRPMNRIAQPLREMGAAIDTTGDRLPITISGRRLTPISYRMPVASAQVKSSLLLAAVAARCSLEIHEEIRTRNHTELLLAHLRAPVLIVEAKPVLVEDPLDPRRKKQQMSHPFACSIKLESSAAISGGEISIPGDISTAAFFFALAAICERSVTVTDVGLNPTRTAFLDYLKSAGATVTIQDRKTVSGEVRGTVEVRGGDLKARKIQDDLTAALIDELPVLAVVAALSDGTTVIRNAEELRVKETDRLLAIAENLRRMGCKVGLLDDGLAIEGGTSLHGADIETFGDHRIAMAFSIAAMVAVGPTRLDDPDCVAISCPAFYELLASVAK